MTKKSVYTQITPIPSQIPRQLAIDMLHSHGEVIELNPLVIAHHQINAPRDAPSDEYFSTWYEITERIQYVPGTGRLGSGKINFRGVFHDMPWGLQTHIYAPMGVDLRNKWQIRGNQPGEPPEPRELGSNAPSEGLYLREDVEIKCNITLVPFVKKELKAASKVLVERMIKKAELIDAELLRQMMHAGIPHTANSEASTSAHPSASPQPPLSPRMMNPAAPSPSMLHDGPSPQNSILRNSRVLQQRQEVLAQSMYLNDPRYRSGQYDYAAGGNVNELPGVPPSQGLAIEMPGDSYYRPQPSPSLYGHHRRSNYLAPSETESTRPSSVGNESQTSAAWYTSQSSTSPPVDGFQRVTSVRSDQKSFVAELPATHN